MRPVRRVDREAEGAPLLREYGPKAHRGFESLTLRHYFLWLFCNSLQMQNNLRKLLDRLAKNYIIRRLISAPVAQLDRAPGYELGGREFESLRARHLNPK